MGTLYYGDNLEILRRYIEAEAVDLVYLDPPFNSAQDYNAFFHEKDGTAAASQIKAFEDTWHWDTGAARVYQQLTEQPGKVSDVMQAFSTFLGGNDMMAYLTMMAPRLIELRRVLKPTGSLYLHCDPTASHYLKLLLDAVFGQESFRNEIIWKRNAAHSDAKQGARHFGRLTDTIFFYAETANSTWHPQYTTYTEKYVDRDYRRIDEQGRRYRLSDISGPGGASKGNPFYEVMGVSRHWRYSREKMEALIKQGRIIQTRPGAVPQYKRYLDEMPGQRGTCKRFELSGGGEIVGGGVHKPLKNLGRIQFRLPVDQTCRPMSHKGHCATQLIHSTPHFFEICMLDLLLQL